MLRLRSYLVALVLVAVLPLALFGAGVAWWAASLQATLDRTDLHRAAVNTAATVAIDLARTTVLIDAMARSPALAEGDLAAFDRHLRSVTAKTGVVLILGTREGTQVINTSVPAGQPVPAVPRPDLVQQTLRQSTPLLTDGIVAPLLKRSVAGLLTQVPQGKPSALIVAARIDPLEMVKLLPTMLRWPGAFAVVYDGKGAPFAAQDAGYGPPPGLTGVARGLERAVEPIPGTGWHVAVFAPSGALAAPWGVALTSMLTVGVVAALIAAILAVILGRFLVSEAGNLVAAAQLLGGEQPAPGRGSLVHELDVLRQALLRAAASARDRIIEQSRLSGLKATATELEHKVAERTRALESLAGRLLNAQDDERRRIARDLHDSTVQELVAASLHLQAIYNASGGAGSPDLVEAMAALGRAKAELRTVSFTMQPPLLDECGLATALRSFAEGFGRRAGLTISFDGPVTDPALPRAIETALFRIAQETLTNAHRHASGSSVQIRLSVATGIVTIEIADDGNGMDVARATVAGSGGGIPGMRARIRQLGGDLAITSGPKGTTIRAWVAIERQAPGRRGTARSAGFHPPVDQVLTG